MQVIPASSPDALTRAVSQLRAGGLVIHATETCYGIACDLQNPVAVRKLFHDKRRPDHQLVSALFASPEAAAEYVEISPKARELMSAHLPGPLTLVLPRKTSARPLWLSLSGGGTDPMIGVRISNHPFAAQLVQTFAGPIATTSANMHGLPSPYTPEEILAQWKDTHSEALLLDHGSLDIAPPSTVVQVVGSGLTVLRQGALHVD